MSWSRSELRVRLAPLNWLKPSGKTFYWPFQGGTSFCGSFMFFLSCFAMPLCVSVYMCLVVTCWERADPLALVCGVYCEFVTFPLVSWVRCGTWLYRVLIFAPLLTFMALDLRQNFVSAQYLENKFHQILYMQSYWHGLAWDCCTLFFALLYQSYGPWIAPKFYFRSIAWEQIIIVISSPNFIYAFILTRSTLGLSHVIFRSFAPELWHLLYA